MTYDEMYLYLKKILPIYKNEEYVKIWKPIRKNSILLITKDDESFVFTMYDYKRFVYETLESFIAKDI